MSVAIAEKTSIDKWLFVHYCTEVN